MLTQRLAELVATTSAASVPASAIDTASLCLLDWLGGALAATVDGPTQVMLRALDDDAAPGGAAVIGRAATASPAHACLVNGVLGHALDFDDTLMAMHGHPSSPTIPALLATAELAGASGEQLLAAYVLAFELQARVGLYLGARHYRRGFHATCTIGTLGAAAGCARLLGLSAAQTRHALGIAASRAGGLKSMFGTMCKPLQVAAAARDGFVAARLAARGVTSREDAIECRDGLADVMDGERDTEAALAELGRSWHLHECLFKLYPSCQATHSSIECAKELANAPGFDATAIEHVAIAVAESNAAVCKYGEPASRFEASFSHPYVVALVFAGLDPMSLASYDGEALASARRRELVARTRVQTVPGLHHLEARVEVTSHGGHVCSARLLANEPIADPERRRQLVEGKFASLVTPLVGAHRAHALRELVSRLRTASDLHGLRELLTASTRTES